MCGGKDCRPGHKILGGASSTPNQQCPNPVENAGVLLRGRALSASVHLPSEVRERRSEATFSGATAARAYVPLSASQLGKQTQEAGTRCVHCHGKDKIERNWCGGKGSMNSIMPVVLNLFATVSLHTLQLKFKKKKKKNLQKILDEFLHGLSAATGQCKHSWGSASLTSK